MGEQSSQNELPQQLTAAGSEDDNSTVITGFPKFSKFPAEIRARIIRYAANDLPPECCRTIWPSIDQNRQLQIRRSRVKRPAVFFVNHEFRQEALRQQIVLAGKRINPYCDILQLPRDWDDNPTPFPEIQQIISQIPRPIRQITIHVEIFDYADHHLDAEEIHELLPDLEVLNVMLVRSRGGPRSVRGWLNEYMDVRYGRRLRHPENACVPGFSYTADEDWRPQIVFAVCGFRGKRGREIEYLPRS